VVRENDVVGTATKVDCKVICVGYVECVGSNAREIDRKRSNINGACAQSGVANRERSGVAVDDQVVS
jgi:hypothetical protein